MKRSVSILAIMLLLAFALPALFHVIMTLIVPMIVMTFVLSLGAMLFQRRRRW